MQNQPLRKIGRLILSMLALSGSIIWYVFYTEAGARLVLQLALRKVFASEEMQLTRLQGTLTQGLELTHLRMLGPGNLPDDSTIEISKASTNPLTLSHFPNVSFNVDNLEMSLPGKIEILKAQFVSGESNKTWSLRGVELAGVKGLPEGSLIRAQEIEASMPLSWSGLQRVKNGRFFFPDEDPVVLDLHRDGDTIRGNLYTNSVDLKKLLSLINVGKNLSGLEGKLKDIRLEIIKQGDSYMLSGPMQFSDFQYQSVAASACPAIIDLSIKAGTKPTFSGQIHLSGGSATIRKTPLSIESATVTFKPGENQPEFNISASTKIEGVAIKVKLKGTMSNPDIKLSSEPSRPKVVLMVMLATGRAWQPAQSVIEKGQVSAEIVSDFIDYWMLGGLGKKLTNRFGVELLSIKFGGTAKGIEIQKSIKDKVDLSTGIEVSEQTTEEKSTRQSIGASYSINPDTKVQLHAERETTQPTDQGSSEDSKKQVNDEVLLKLKKSF